jgi:hypothetical protein
VTTPAPPTASYVKASLIMLVAPVVWLFSFHILVAHLAFEYPVAVLAAIALLLTASDRFLARRGPFR